MSRTTLYRFALSGHSHRAEVALSLLGRPCTLVEVDLRAGEHKSPAFLAKNGFGQVPVLDDDGEIVADSNAILVYLARRYDPTDTWLPRHPRAQAEVQRWFSVAAGPLAYGPAAARRALVFGAKLDQEEAIARSHALFTGLEAALSKDDWLVGSGPTLADIAMYTYTAHAPEGGVSLAEYPHLRGWLSRFEALPGFFPMVRTPVGLWG
jgi:glutathione S-transferase